MSLLIKALEQAAKDRKQGSVEPTERVPATAETASAEPTLEPAPAPRSPRAEAAPAPAPRSPPAEAAPERPEPERASVRATPTLASAARTGGASAAALASIEAQQQRARAATVMQASGGGTRNMIAYFRRSPLMALAAAGVLFGVGFGVYVYLQITNPGLFVRQAAAPKPAPAAPAPPPQIAPPVASESTPARVAMSAADLAAGPAPSAGSIPAPGASAPIPSKALIGTGPAEAPRELAPARERLAPPAAAPEAARAAPKPAPAMAPGPAPEPVARERITVSPGTAQVRLNPMLAEAYSLLQAGNLGVSRALYARVSETEPLNLDALLGLAYIAALENRGDDAVRLYMRILQLNPRHAHAQAALIGLMGRADPLASETRLKELIVREPTAFLHFVLGNLYADQRQWAPAQQSYFQAHHLEPGNPDYAYNLAVGLDHLRQSKLALAYYRRAEQLASARAHANFDITHARERIRALSSQID